jgi:YVTN family beta-propeller protein
MKAHIISFLFACAALSSCTRSATVYKGEYPDDVAAIINNKCATAGCHNEKSFANAANLRLDRWEHLWKGSGTGAVIVPYSIKNSSLLYFINADTNEGPILQPRMPLNMGALSPAEYATIRAWVAAGAPDKTGVVPFADHTDTRQKIYVTQQGCDLIAVIDAVSKLTMRYIDIGMELGIETPHCVRFSPDGRYAYVSFTGGQYLQKIDAATDRIVGNIFLGDGSWNLFQVSQKGDRILITDFDKGKIKLLDLDAMSVLVTYEDFTFPHGVASTPNFDTFFVTAQYGNTVYRLTAKGGVRRFSIDDEESHFRNDTRNPHEIMMSPDGSKYFLSCQGSNEVRVMDSKTNKLLKAIPVGTFPQELALSNTKPYLFVTCEEEATAEFPKFLGAVYVIDYNTLEVVKRIPGPFYQIHGVTVDDHNGLVYIVSRNISATGPAPHHTSQCGGRNGYYNVYDLNTLQPADSRSFESVTDPYSADVRFK